MRTPAALRPATWSTSTTRYATILLLLLGAGLIVLIIHVLSLNWTYVVGEFEAWGLIGAEFYSAFVALLTALCFLTTWRRDPTFGMPVVEKGEITGPGASLVLQGATTIAQAFLGINGFLLMGKGYFASLPILQYDALLATLVYVIGASGLGCFRIFSRLDTKLPQVQPSKKTDMLAKDAAEQTATKEGPKTGNSVLDQASTQEPTTPVK